MHDVTAIPHYYRGQWTELEGVMVVVTVLLAISPTACTTFETVSESLIIIKRHL